MQNYMNQPPLQAPLIQNQPDLYAPTNYNLPPESDIRQSQSYAADVNQLKEKKTSYHVKSLIGTFFLWVGIPVVVAITVSKMADLSVGASAGICAGIYALYLILALCCNPLFSYLNNVEHGGKFR